MCAIVSQITPNLSQLNTEALSVAVFEFTLGSGLKCAYNGLVKTVAEATIIAHKEAMTRATVLSHKAAQRVVAALSLATLLVTFACTQTREVNDHAADWLDVSGGQERPRRGDSVADAGHMTDTLVAIADYAPTDHESQVPEILALIDVLTDSAKSDGGWGIDQTIAADDGSVLPFDLEMTSDSDSAPEASDTSPADLPADGIADVEKEASCPYQMGVCLGLNYHWCDPETDLEHIDDCGSAAGTCLAATCINEVGCKLLPSLDGLCDDGDPCTIGDQCVGGACNPGTPNDCDDGNPCTDDLCEPATGACAHSPNALPCGSKMQCVDGLCTPTYPAMPHGPFQGDIMANHIFFDPDNLSEHSMQEFYLEGEVLLITFNAGWCKVCKEDTEVLNNWIADSYDDGLRVLSILYETPEGTPINQGYAQWWDEHYALTFPLWMDTPTADAEGKAEGGVLASYRKPAGPVSQGYFPVTMIVCPATMEILYIDKGFYDEIVEETVEHWLYLEECG